MDLSGFDPDAWAANGAGGSLRRRRCSSWTPRGSRRWARAVSRSRAHLTGSASSRSPTIMSSCTRSSAGMRSSRRTTRPCGRTGCSCTSLGKLLDKPLYVRAGERRRRRIALLSGCSSSRSPRAGSASSRSTHPCRPSSRPTRTPRSRSSSSRPRRSNTSVQTCPAPPGISPPTTHASSATLSSTGSRAASAPRRERSGSRTTSPAPAPRRG